MIAQMNPHQVALDRYPPVRLTPSYNPSRVSRPLAAGPYSQREAAIIELTLRGTKQEMWARCLQRLEDIASREENEIPVVWSHAPLHLVDQLRAGVDPTLPEVAIG